MTEFLNEEIEKFNNPNHKFILKNSPEKTIPTESFITIN